MNILMNMPYNFEKIMALEKYAEAFRQKNEIFINTRMFEGNEEKCIMREIAGILHYVTKCRTFRIDGKITGLQRRIVHLANELGIEIENIDLRRGENWYEDIE